MKVEKLIEIIGSDFYSGVPDSQLKALCNYLMATYGIDPQHHVIAANEGNCTALAAGYHLATGKVPVVYMQNSGEGNIINPVASLLNDKVYVIPMVFIVGWRGGLARKGPQGACAGGASRGDSCAERDDENRGRHLPASLLCARHVVFLSRNL